MKFKDIPKFTRSGAYAVDVPWDMLPKWINDKIEHMGLQMEPLFQRGHVWTEAQQIAYIEFVLRGGKNGLTTYFNCPGWDRRLPDGSYNDFVCVDGLQRITAILAFMDNRIPAFGFYLKDYEDPIPFDANIRININDLQNEEDVLQWYVDLNAGGTPHTNYEIEKVRSMIRKIKREKANE